MNRFKKSPTYGRLVFAASIGLMLVCAPAIWVFRRLR